MIGWGDDRDTLPRFQRRADLMAAAAAFVWVLVWAVTR